MSELASSQTTDAPGNIGALTGIDPKSVLQRYLDGENSVQIAEGLGITKQRLSFWLLKNAEQEWKDVQVAKAIEQYDEALDELNVAKEGRDAIDLAYVREKLKSAQWQLERVCRRIYGQDAPPAGTSAVQINIGIRAAQQCSTDSESVTAEIISKP